MNSKNEMLNTNENIKKSKIIPSLFLICCLTFMTSNAFGQNNSTSSNLEQLNGLKKSLKKVSISDLGSSISISEVIKAYTFKGDLLNKEDLQSAISYGLMDTESEVYVDANNEISLIVFSKKEEIVVNKIHAKGLKKISEEDFFNRRIRFEDENYSFYGANNEKLIPKDVENKSYRTWVVRLGGKAYNIGLGGGNCSSRNQTEKQSSQDFVAVQRGNPEMENRLVRLIEKCSNLGLFLSIHDQGAGGNGNVLKEIIEGQGTNAVKVKWGVEEKGIISVKELTSNCASAPVNLEVQLNINAISLDKSIARIWNEVLLQAIRNDFARPTVHARNLFHISVALYDTWAIYNEMAKPYLIGNDVHNFSSELLEKFAW